MGKKIIENKKEVKKMIKNNVPLNKFGSPKDISSAKFFYYQRMQVLLQDQILSWMVDN